MPNIASAKKALRQNIARRAKNAAQKVDLKKAIKTFRKLTASKEMEKAKELLSKTQQVIDKTAKSGVIKKNTASRLKSRLSKLIA